MQHKVESEEGSVSSICRIAVPMLLLFAVGIGCRSDLVPTEERVSPLSTPSESIVMSSPLRPTATALESLDPQEGKATVAGVVISREDGKPLADTGVRLAEVYRQEGEGAFVLDDALSPGATTDQNGRFVIENVDPKEYVIVVGNVGTQYDIVAEPSGQAEVWELPPDQVVDVGTLEVELHP